VSSVWSHTLLFCICKGFSLVLLCY
jgi:hypothetical protein